MCESKNITKTKQPKDIKKFVFKYGALYSTIAALISDVIKPLFEFTFLFLIICVSLLAIELTLGASSVTNVGKKINSNLHNITNGYWIKPILYATLISFFILLITFLLNNNNDEGFISEHSDIIKIFQVKLNNILTLGEETKEEITKLKKETSDDPRKELTNLGITWGDRAYYQAIKNHDLRILKLFWEGGINPYYKFEDSDQPIIFYHIYFGKDNWQSLLQLFIDNNQINLKNDKFMPEKWMFMNIPRSNIGFDTITLQNYIDKNTLSFGQILFCSKLNFKIDDDIKLFNELVNMGADKNQLIDILIKIKKALELMYNDEFNEYNLASRSSLRRVKNTIQYLPKLEKILKNT